MNRFFASMICFLSGFMFAVYPHFLLPLKNMVTITDANVLNICFIHYHPELYLGICVMAAAVLSFKYKKAQFISILLSIVSLIHAITLKSVSFYTFGEDMMIAANTSSIRSHTGIKYVLLVLAVIMLISSSLALKKQKPLLPKISIFLYAWDNLKMRRFRSSSLILTSAIVTIVTLVSFFVFETVEKSLKLSYQRLKADIVVVPKGEETKAINLITKGEPTLFYFAEGVYEKLKKVRGIDELSPQLYLQPFSYDIESTIDKVLIVAFDPTSDFIVNPWIEYSIGQKNEVSGLTAGYKVKYYPGQEIKLFGKKRRILTSLISTGIGYLDHAVFIPLDEAREFISQLNKTQAATMAPKKRLPGLGFMDSSYNTEPDLTQINQDTFSVVFIKAAKGISVKSLTKNIYDSVKGVSVIDINTTAKEEKKHLLSKTKPLIIPAFTIIVFGSVILFTVFSMMVNERKSEIGMLRALGAKRKDIFYGIVIEATLITATGLFLGIIFGNAVFFVLKNSIMGNLGFLYVWPSPAAAISVFALTFAVNIPVTLCAAIYPAMSAARIEPYAAIREG